MTRMKSGPDLRQTAASKMHPPLSAWKPVHPFSAFVLERSLEKKQQPGIINKECTNEGSFYSSDLLSLGGGAGIMIFRSLALRRAL